MSAERFRRDDPERTDPIRNFSTTLRGDGRNGATAPTDPPDWLGEEATAAAGDPARPGVSDFVGDGVRLGYDVLFDQMRRGQSFAAQHLGGFGAAVPNAGPAAAADLRKIVERLLRSYSDMFLETTLIWIDLVLSVKPPEAPSPRWSPNAGRSPESPGSPASPAAPIPVTVFSSRPTRCDLKLDPGAEAQPLEACQLWARDTAKPPLLDVSFNTGSEGKVFLRVRVPDDQPADLYLGVVCHRTTGEPLGTLAVEIR